MIILTFVEGALDVNLINVGILVLVTSVAASIIGLVVAGITMLGALVWAVISG